MMSFSQRLETKGSESGNRELSNGVGQWIRFKKGMGLRRMVSGRMVV
ncbi:hypothetical protein VDG1235_630 [Verrucomicrobiia bacterium DG1235]|nr:hypothetical protein VDG1235_630 [Verrucomicrobiae bacterium DG1235]